MDIRARLKNYFANTAGVRDSWRAKNSYYHSLITEFFRSRVPPDGELAEVGCSTGNLLAALPCCSRAGIDFCAPALEIARRKYPGIEFIEDDIEALKTERRFDCVICTDTLSSVGDVWRAARNLRRLCRPEATLVLTHTNYLWEPLLRLGETFGLKARQPLQHWLTLNDIGNLMELSGFSVRERGSFALVPVKIPLLSALANKLLARLPVLRHLCLVEYIVARPSPEPQFNDDAVVSVIVPTRDEAGHIKPLLGRLPRMGRQTEVVFVDGDSSDGTYELLEEALKTPPDGFSYSLIKQGGRLGKADAMRKGFAAATGDYFLILDSDLSVAPEDLPKFYLAMAEGRADFVNGSRLNYPLQDQAMRYLNNIANHAFGYIFSWLLERQLRDTLCGTKTLSRENYRRISEGRAYFGDFDPFGDFDLLFGAARLGLNIREMPVRYRSRAYGDTKISRFSHGWLLLKMCVVAARKLKFSSKPAK
ncbi:MAG: glycosyltransferase [Elusimicrobia bacterium]|nr:glycosyltransferase [Elusimicrobiota bacterium]